MSEILAGRARRPIALMTVAGLALALGCAPGSGPDLSKKTTQGAILGGVVGAAAGRAIGGHDHAAAGIAIGALTGAVAGGLIGRYLDQQAQELDAIPDANVERYEDHLVVGQHCVICHQS